MSFCWFVFSLANKANTNHTTDAPQPSVSVCHVSQLCFHRKLSNQIKNRYSDVLCLDQSRVRLCELSDDEDEVII